MSVSPLAQCVIPSPNHSGARTRAIDTVSIHCMAGDLSVESCGALFARPSTRASSNYGIGSDGRVALYVDEANRSWCSSSAENDDRAVTIEVANCGGADEGWPVSEAAYDSLIDLLTDVCRRNGIAKLLWRSDRSLVGQTDKQNMTVHRWFAQKSCPGDWLYAPPRADSGGGQRQIRGEYDRRGNLQGADGLPVRAERAGLGAARAARGRGRRHNGRHRPNVLRAALSGRHNGRPRGTAYRRIGTGVPINR